MLLAFLLLLLAYATAVQAALVRSLRLSNSPTTDYLLEKFIIDVALDEEHKQLKFFINSMVSNLLNLSDPSVLIDDVDPVTNKFTTLHVQIEFKGATIIDENLRFCDYVSVKNTSGLFPSARYPLKTKNSTTTLNTTIWSAPNVNFNHTPITENQDQHLFPSQWIAQVDAPSVDLARSNTTIEQLFTNSTGNLVQCPLYQNDSVAIYYQADVEKHFDLLGSYTVRFSVISNGENSEVIGGAKTYVTPAINPEVFANVLFFGTLALLLFATIMKFIITVSSPAQETNNPFLAEASTIRNVQFLRQLEASTSRIVSYLQFAIFMAGLNIEYPGFFQPVMGQIKWCLLLGFDFLLRKSSSRLVSGNIYVTMDVGGLESLALYTSDGNIELAWPNFMITLFIWMALALASYQLFICLRLLSRGRKSNAAKARNDEPVNDIFEYSWVKNIYALVGHILRQFLHTFGFVVMTLTLFMIHISSSNQIRMLFFNDNLVSRTVFLFNMPYAYLFPHPRSAMGLKRYEDMFPSSRNTVHLVLSILTLIVWLLIVFFFVFRYLITFKHWRLQANPNVRKLYTSTKSVVMWAYLYNYYRPERVQYVIVDFAHVIVSSIIIGSLQSYGGLQVSLMVVLEFSKAILFFVVRPLFLRQKIYSIPVTLTLARLLIVLLNIPYASSLNMSELVRTNVAFAQLIVHAVVASYFFVTLSYCVFLWIKALVQDHRFKTHMDAPEEVRDSRSSSTFEDFEFEAVGLPETAVTKRETNPDIQEAEEDEHDYFRARSEWFACEKSPQFRKQSATPDVELDTFSILHVQDRQRNDYTTREGDRVFEKLLADDDIDPEIRQLWASRDWKEQKSLRRPAKPDNNVKKQSRSWWRKKQPVRSFEVRRPRQLVVRELPQPTYSALEDEEKW